MYEEDFIKTMTDYLLYKEDIDVKALKEKIAIEVIYFSDISSNKDSNSITISIERGNSLEKN